MLNNKFKPLLIRSQLIQKRTSSESILCIIYYIIILLYSRAAKERATRMFDATANVARLPYPVTAVRRYVIYQYIHN